MTLVGNNTLSWAALTLGDTAIVPYPQRLLTDWHRSTVCLFRCARRACQAQHAAQQRKRIGMTEAACCNQR